MENKQNDISKPISNEDKDAENQGIEEIKDSTQSTSLKDSKPFMIGVYLLIAAIVVVGRIFIYQHVHNNNLAS